MITNKLEYLLLILIDLALSENDKYIATKDVAKRQEIPLNYIPQLMALLSNKGWVDSCRGCKGGVMLIADPAKITISNVAKVANEPLTIKACVSPKHKCHRKEECPLNMIWFQAQQSINGIFETTTLADLLKIKSRLSKKSPSKTNSGK